MIKLRYFLIQENNDAITLNKYLEELERKDIEYDCDFDTDHKKGIFVEVSIGEN